MPNNIKIKNGKSSLSEFVKKPLPTEKEVEAFDDFIENKVRENEIKDSLAEIYQDDDGNVVDVRKLEKKKQRGFFFWLFTLIFLAGILSGTIYYGYNYYFLRLNPVSSLVDLSIATEKEILAGEEFFYTVDYKNRDKVSLNNIEIKLTYSENFIFIESQPAPSQKNNIWQITSLGPHRSDLIKIKGKLVGPEEKNNIVLADMIYVPANFSSEFKKSSSFETKISQTGLEFVANSPSSVIVGEESQIIVKYKAKEENYLNNFRLILELPANLEFINPEASQPASGQPLAAKTEATASGTTIIKPGVFFVNNLTAEEKDLLIGFRVKEKGGDRQDLLLKFDYLASAPAEGEEKYYPIYEKTISFDVIKSDLNVSLIINGSSLDQGINFGQILNYSINYINRGEKEMKDILLMAVLESDFLDWQTLQDSNNGKISGNTISWSKEEIPSLATLTNNQEGVIDFFIKLKPYQEIDLSKSYQVKSYVQFSIEGKITKSGVDNQSNTIINKINSDLTLTEGVRYFNDDNIAVGSGPLPPKVNETTSFKVYWEIGNSLHELNNLEVVSQLPSYVKWDDKNRTSVGSIEYDNQENKVIWRIGRLPITVYQANAEFNISITPSETDRNKILVLLPGTTVSAVDNETQAVINKTGKAKTTKLEDDDIAKSDGIVE